MCGYLNFWLLEIHTLVFPDCVTHIYRSPSPTDGVIWTMICRFIYIFLLGNKSLPEPAHQPWDLQV